jgi:hypothetical protein
VFVVVGVLVESRFLMQDDVDGRGEALDEHPEASLEPGHIR